MKKDKLKRIIIIAIILGLSILLWIIFKTSSIPSKIKLILPNDTEIASDDLKSIDIRIDKNDTCYLNDIKTDFSLIQNKLDSLGELEYNDSIIYIYADKRAK